MKENALAVFENYKIRRHFDEEIETWFFGGRYYSGFDSTARLSSRPELLESVEKPTEQRRQSVGYKL